MRNTKEKALRTTILKVEKFSHTSQKSRSEIGGSGTQN